jgi:hypothetical protein
MSTMLSGMAGSQKATLIGPLQLSEFLGAKAISPENSATMLSGFHSKQSGLSGNSSSQ